jgi:aryl-alcohol dehydrogenase-like predicted oxidoreductase
MKGANMAENKQTGKDSLTRRQFMHDSALTAAGLAVGLGAISGPSAHTDEAVRKTRSYNPDMEYRRLGKTNIWVSAVCMGGHWKRIDKMVPGVFWWETKNCADHEGFMKNRCDVISRCIELGINHIDACIADEVLAYAKALKGRRDKMFLGVSWYEGEMRNPERRTAEALLKTLDEAMLKAGLDYVDLWRITMHEQSGRHTKAEVDEMMKALETARKQGKARFTGFSSHDRPHIKWMIETYPDVIQVVVTPYTARSKVLPKDSLFDAVKKHDIGVFGIKPFSSNALFKGDGSLGNPHAAEDDRIARMAIRHILCNPAITAPIPGLINTHQVDNMVKAVKEQRQLDAAEAKQLREAMDRAWVNLPQEYQWLKDWEYV